MGTETAQLDLALKDGETLRNEGVASVIINNRQFVDLMRKMAKEICEKNETGTVTTDDLQRYAEKHGLVPKHQNSWGSIFREPGWRIVGRQPSTVPSNHHREIRVWARLS